jgi:predicted RNase H-like HicB family nuclease
MTKTLSVIVERDEDGYYIASVPELPGCHTQARTLDELANRVRKAVSIYLSVRKEEKGIQFVGVQLVEI